MCRGASPRRPRPVRACDSGGLGLAPARPSADVALAASCAGPSDRVRVVGGVVRDAFLGRTGGDLDLSVASPRANSFAARLAARAGSRVVAVGAPPRRILKVPFQGREIDVWAEEGGEEADLLRRDFTVNAVSFTLPEGRLGAAPGALLDLEKKRLAPPRPGVFLEDSLRVLRAARFLAQLPGFRVAREALLEIRAAGRFLRKVAAERRLVEMDKLLGAPAADRARALRFLERVGALQSLVRGSAPRRRRGISLVRRLESSDPRIARALLLLPQGPKRAEDLLRRWKTSREEQRLASRLFALPLRRTGHGAPTRHDVAELLRLSSPFEGESTAYLKVAGDRRSAALARAAEKSFAARPYFAGSSGPFALFHSKKSSGVSTWRKAPIWGTPSTPSTSPSPPGNSAAPATRGPGWMPVAGF